VGNFSLEKRGNKDRRGRFTRGTRGMTWELLGAKRLVFFEVLVLFLFVYRKNTFISIVCVLIQGYLTIGIKPLASGSAWY